MGGPLALACLGCAASFEWKGFFFCAKMLGVGRLRTTGAGPPAEGVVELGPDGAFAGESLMVAVVVVIGSCV